jgi:DNA-binding NarL/FixJ family response regulator
VAERPVILIAVSGRDSRSQISALFREAGFATVEVQRGAEVLQYAKRGRPAAALLDVNLGDMSTYEVCHQLRQRFGEEPSITFISGKETEPQDRVAGHLIGVDDFITEPFDPTELLALVRRRLAKSASRQGVVDSQLTPREQEVLEIMATGVPTNQIARKLFISHKTVGTHIQRILSKLGVHSRTEAVAVAYRSGLVDSNGG